MTNSRNSAIWVWGQLWGLRPAPCSTSDPRCRPRCSDAPPAGLPAAMPPEPLPATPKCARSDGPCPPDARHRAASCLPGPLRSPAVAGFGPALALRREGSNLPRGVVNAGDNGRCAHCIRMRRIAAPEEANCTFGVLGIKQHRVGVDGGWYYKAVIWSVVMLASWLSVKYGTWVLVKNRFVWWTARRFERWSGLVSVLM